WHIGDVARTLAHRIAGKRAAVDDGLASEWSEQPEQRLEQRGLAPAVGAEQREHLTLRERYIEPAPDHAIAVADGEIATGECHDQLRCMSASSQMKNGVPMTAVRMPSGISTGAAVRASVSMNRRKPPPSSAEAGSSLGKSGPTSARARCGTTSPI